MRRYANSAVKGFLLNFAQVVFAKTFNVLYQQRITDVNTMFKVFRSECLDGVDLECDGFNLDIELACKLVKHGNAPLEVPVNYVSRGFDEGKRSASSATQRTLTGRIPRSIRRQLEHLQLAERHEAAAAAVIRT